MASSHEAQASSFAERAESAASLQRPAEEAGALALGLHRIKEVRQSRCSHASFMNPWYSRGVVEGWPCDIDQSPTPRDGADL